MNHWFKLFAATLIATVLLLPSIAEARPGWVTVALNLRAGPAISYPVVYVIPYGTKVEVIGCQYGWCQIAVLDYTGYVAARYISYRRGYGY